MSIPSWNSIWESAREDCPLTGARITECSSSAKVEDSSGSGMHDVSGRSSIMAFDPFRLPARGRSRSSAVTVAAAAVSLLTMSMRFLNVGAFSLAAALDLGERIISEDIRDLVRRWTGL